MQATSIGVNVEGRNGTPNTLTPDQIAGVVPQGNWNNEVGGQGSQGTETYSSLVDSSGQGSAITLTATYSDSWFSNSAVAGTSPTPDNILLNGIIKVSGNGGGNNTGTLVWNNVPAGSYKVDLELAENGPGAIGTISIGSNSQQLIEPDGGTEQGAVTYVTNPNDTVDVSNYAEFTNVSPDGTGAISINISHDSGSDGFGIPGIQLTSVPEPASLGLLAIGAAGLLGRRRQIV
ncbi:MAG TPA: PEP-CTERM sorting domain-containing protein [Tepidisphaeraceae bacterium]|nr:PEP-CTERM sorting domain-containing protein [Tepidisphaeraceae bacterium]